MKEKNMSDLAMEAFVYGFPLVFNLKQIERITTDGIGSMGIQKFNEFTHATILANAKDEFVSVNNDTLYSTTMLDMSVGPLKLEVPDTNGRYYVLQFVDAWTNNFAYVGKRATGTKAIKFYLTPPNWEGIVPDGYKQIRIPTRIATIIGRWQCDNVEDIENIKKIQAKVLLTQEDEAKKFKGLPVTTSKVDAELEFFEKLRIAMWELLPAKKYVEYQKQFEILGLTQGEPSPYLNIDTNNKDILIEVQEKGVKKLQEYLEHGVRDVENGWILSFHMFDFNDSYFEVGTIEKPQFILSDQSELFLSRAAYALSSLWGNHAYEAAYITAFVDTENEELTGEHEYELTLSPPPPVDAFWSITMYDVPNYYLVENELGRYSIGDRTKGIIYNSDGSITITVSNKKPTDPIRLANWLPAPKGLFRPMFRLYLPGNEILNKDYHFAGFKKI